MSNNKKSKFNQSEVMINTDGLNSMIELFHSSRQKEPIELNDNIIKGGNEEENEPSFMADRDAMLQIFDARKKAVQELIKNAPKEITKQKAYVLKLRQEEKKMLSDRITDIIRVNLNITPSRNGKVGYVRGKITDGATGLWIKFPNEIFAKSAVEILKKYNYVATQIGSEINTSLISTPEEVVKQGTSILENIEKLKNEEKQISEKVKNLKDKPINDSQVTEKELLEKIWNRLIKFNCGIMDLRTKIIVKDDGSLSFPTLDKELFMFLMENVSVEL